MHAPDHLHGMLSSFQLLIILLKDENGLADFSRHCIDCLERLFRGPVEIHVPRSNQSSIIRTDQIHDSSQLPYSVAVKRQA
jgi:hypothetical protein